MHAHAHVLVLCYCWAIDVLMCILMKGGYHCIVQAGRDLMPAVLWCRQDDETRTQLRAQLAEMRPVEVVLPAGGLSEATQKVTHPR